MVIFKDDSFFVAFEQEIADKNVVHLIFFSLNCVAANVVANRVSKVFLHDFFFQIPYEIRDVSMSYSVL